MAEKKMAMKKTAEKTEVKSKVKEIKDVKNVESKAETKVKSEPPKKSNIVPIEEIFNVSKTETKGETKVETPKETPKKDTPTKKISAGAQIRNIFTENIAKITDKEMEVLTSAEKTKEVLKIRYAFLKKSTDNKEDRKVNGNARYGSKTIEINGVEYWLTNDIYSKQVPIFEKWIKSIK